MAWEEKCGVWYRSLVVVCRWTWGSHRSGSQGIPTGAIGALRRATVGASAASFDVQQITSHKASI